jgi:hypothetical protein
MGANNMSDIDAEVEAFLRTSLNERLSLCTEAQRDKFARIFPGSVPSERLRTAIDLCDRTIAKNKSGRT